jgi:hypothetical protein
MATRDGINTPAVAIVGFLGSLIVFIIIVLLIVVYYGAEERQRAAKDFTGPPAEIRRLVSNQEGQLADYRMLDAQRQVVAIPVRRAMEAVVAELAKDPAARPFPKPQVIEAQPVEPQPLPAESGEDTAKQPPGDK